MCTAVSYKKLFKLMIDLDMKKKDLQQVAGLSPATITKLERVHTKESKIIANKINPAKTISSLS